MKFIIILIALFTLTFQINAQVIIIEDDNDDMEEFYSIKKGVIGDESTITDLRDMMTYQTIKLGNLLWMTENMAYKNTGWYKNEKFYKRYGVLYNLEEAKNICPQGWRLPTEKEWRFAEVTLGGDNKQKGWRTVKNLSVLKLKKAGWKKRASYRQRGDYAGFWTSDGKVIKHKDKKLMSTVKFDSNIRLSVRCIKKSIKK